VTLRKNVASQKLVFTLVNATTGAALTGATVTAKLSIDGGASATATGAVVELANGQYVWSPDAADTNGTAISVQFTATNAVPRAFTVYTVNYDTTAATVPANTTHFGGTAGTFASGIPETKVASVAAGAITAAAIATDAIDADALAADAVTEIQAGLSTLTEATVRTAVGLASANLDTQLGDLPTNAELATALAAADDAVLAAIAALNNLSSVGAQAAAAAALTAYSAATAAQVPTAVQNADALLRRTISGGDNGGRDVTSALRALRNKVDVGASTVTVYREDDATTAWSGTVTRTEGLDPLQTVDPT